uniref:Secreted protein n=1 Tax=Haemonchus contortus TaxID=6289 RepID=A0A7I4YQR5_HAECO
SLLHFYIRVIMIASLVVFVLLIPSIHCQGGMAELKAITGDEPYSGPGPNSPMPVPKPQGFWGRPRYSPVGYYGGSSYLGGARPYYGGGSGYTSLSYSPYGLELGQLPFEGPPTMTTRFGQQFGPPHCLCRFSVG